MSAGHIKKGLIEIEGWGRLKLPTAVHLEPPLVFRSQERKPQAIGRMGIWGSVSVSTNVGEF